MLGINGLFMPVFWVLTANRAGGWRSYSTGTGPHYQ
jgi:hypothetical protein